MTDLERTRIARALLCEQVEKKRAATRNLERWFQTLIQAGIIAACGFVLWAVCCGGFR